MKDVGLPIEEELREAHQLAGPRTSASFAPSMKSSCAIVLQVMPGHCRHLWQAAQVIQALDFPGL